MHLSKLKLSHPKNTTPIFTRIIYSSLKNKKRGGGKKKSTVSCKYTRPRFFHSLSKPRSRRKGAPEQAHPARISSG